MSEKRKKTHYNACAKLALPWIWIFLYSASHIMAFAQTLLWSVNILKLWGVWVKACPWSGYRRKVYCNLWLPNGPGKSRRPDHSASISQPCPSTRHEPLNREEINLFHNTWRHLGKPRLMVTHKEQALIRRRAFCAASDQSLNFLSYLSVCKKHFSRFQHNYKRSMNIKAWKRLI